MMNPHAEDAIRSMFENACMNLGRSIERRHDGRYASLDVQRKFELVAVPLGYEPPRDSNILKVVAAMTAAIMIAALLASCGGSGNGGSQQQGTHVAGQPKEKTP